MKPLVLVIKREDVIFTYKWYKHAIIVAICLKNNKGLNRMKKIKIHGNQPLHGDVYMSGAKNSTVALIPAAILADSPVTLLGVPDIEDVYALIEIIEEMGAKADYDALEHRLVIDPRQLLSIPMPQGRINSLRASYYFMGALLAKFGEAIVGLPGGCNLGPRPIDLHIKGFKALGVTEQHRDNVEYLTTDENGLVGTRIFMDLVSIGATINVMLAAVKAKGVTIIENAAREPEVVDVAMLLNNMGAKISGAGTDQLYIEGVTELHGVTHRVVPDRIEAGTYLTIAAACGSFDGVTLHNVIPEHLDAFIAKLTEAGVKLDVKNDTIHVQPLTHELKGIDIQTAPYPGFATDLQQPITPLLFKAKSTSHIHDNIYPQRTRHVPELQKMGANISVDDEGAIKVEPTQGLHGADVMASDLRAGACLVCAGLMAEGDTYIGNIHHILRGYDHIVEKLSALGADIEMVEVDEA